MPRIDPIQLLNCLSILLSPNGAIKSRDEVHRLANLMTKFSKKLVSKCIYIQILKCTETELLELFMGSRGWRLVHMWLTESIVAKNWPLVRELLELLLLCPVDVERLKTNNCPKLVKELSKDGNHFAIRALASKLVEQWLKAVKGEQVTPIVITDIPQIISDFQLEIKSENVKIEEISDNYVENKLNDLHNSQIVDNETKDIKLENNVNNSERNDHNTDEDETEDPNNKVDTLPVLKISLKNGKQILSQVEEDSKVSEDDSEKEKSKEKHKSRSRDKSRDKSSSNSRSSSSKHSSSKSTSDKSKSSIHKDSSRHSSKDKYKDRDRSSSHSSKSKTSSSSSSSSSKKSSSSSSSSSKSRDSKSNQKHDSVKDKSKDKKDRKSSTEKSEDKVQTSIQKLGKIPKLSDVKKEKPSISIEVRKPDEPKPKTVKTFHSKFRKHGLEEEIKPPPSRATLLSNKKPPPVLPPTVSIPKRPSPVHSDSPPEKKSKTIVDIDKPGAIKLIPAKPKPMVLQESDMFMDALNASATIPNKKEPKKRKRRTSGSKDAQSDGSPPQTPTITSSPNSESKSVPPRFYQDTLDEEDHKDKDKITEKEMETIERTEKLVADEQEPEENMDTSEPHTLTINGLKGVLCYHKRKGPKKSIRWKPDSELEEIQYFELDETERVNVTKTFTDMKHLERVHERESFQKARNLSNDDVMEERTSWRPLIPVDVGGQIQIDYGKGSKEKDIQAIRQKGTLQPLYFHKSMIPDSPHEPDAEAHTYTEPTTIPLEDVTGNQDNISDFRNMPWPEAKGNAPPASSNNLNVPPMFPSNLNQFPNSFAAPPQFPGVPGFQGPPIMPGDWTNGGVPPIMPNGIPGPMTGPGMAPGSMPPANMPPGLMAPPDMMMGPDMFGNPNPMFPPVPPDGFNMQPNMFPVDYNMSGPPGPDGFPGPPNNFRGAMRGRGAGGHWRGKGVGNWEGPPRGRGGGRGGGRKAVCIYFQRKGSCRQGDNCSFLHPGVNCPF